MGAGAPLRIAWVKWRASFKSAPPWPAEVSSPRAVIGSPRKTPRGFFVAEPFGSALYAKDAVAVFGWALSIEGYHDFYERTLGGLKDRDLTIGSEGCVRAAERRAAARDLYAAVVHDFEQWTQIVREILYGRLIGTPNGGDVGMPFGSGSGGRVARAVRAEERGG